MSTNMTNPTLPDVLISVGDSAVPTYELSGWVIETPSQASARVARENAEARDRLNELGALSVLRVAAEQAAAANSELTDTTSDLSATHPDGETPPVDLENPTQ